MISAGIGLFIFPRTWTLLREAVGVLLEGTPSDVNVTALREAIESVPGVAEAHDLHVWSLASGMNAMSAHAVLADGALHDEVLAAVRERVTSNFKIAHVTVQVESRGFNPFFSFRARILIFVTIIVLTTIGVIYYINRHLEQRIASMVAEHINAISVKDVLGDLSPSNPPKARPKTDANGREPELVLTYPMETEGGDRRVVIIVSPLSRDKGRNRCEANNNYRTTSPIRLGKFRRYLPKRICGTLMLFFDHATLTLGEFYLIFSSEQLFIYSGAISMAVSARKTVADACEIEFVDERKVRRVQRAMKPGQVVSALAETFKLLGDPTRIKIVFALRLPSHRRIDVTTGGEGE